MQTTLNFGLKKIELSDSPPDITVSNSNWDEVDKHLFHTAKFQKATGTATAITLSGVNLTDGFVVQFIASADNNGVSTTINGKSVYKEGTTVPPKLKTGKAVIAWYDATKTCFFVKASAGGGTAVAGDVLAGKTFSNDDDSELQGTIPIVRPDVSDQIPALGRSVGKYSNDENTYAYLQIPSGKYIDPSINWVRYGANDLVSSNIRTGKNILGISGSLNALDAIRGVTRSYYAYADENISAGDFVKYITGVSGVGAGTAQYRIMTPLSTNMNWLFVAGILDETHVLIAFNGSNSYINFVVVTIDGVEFSIGTVFSSTLLSSTIGDGMGFYPSFNTQAARIIALSTTKAIFCTTYNGYMHMYVVNLSNFVVTSIGSPNNTLVADVVLDAVAVNSSQFVICTGDDGNYVLQLTACSVNGNTITLSTVTITYGYAGANFNWGRVTISPDKTRIFAMWNYGNSVLAHAAVFQLSGANITSLSGDKTYSVAAAATLNLNAFQAISNTMVIAVGSFSGSSNMNACAIAFSDSLGITNFNYVAVDTTSNYPAGCAIIPLPNDRALMILDIFNTSTRIARVISLNGKLPVAQTVVSFNKGNWGVASFSKLITGSKVLMFSSIYNSGYAVQGMILNAPANAVETLNYLYETQVKKSTSNDDINGVAITGAIGGIATGSTAGHNQACNVISKV